MEIGSLTGVISIEDQISDKLTEVARHVKDFATEVEGAFGAAAIGVTVLGAAIAGAVVSIVELGEKGSKIQGVTDAFDRLAASAGTTGDALRGSLSEGVKDTIDQMTLMQSTMRLMTSGMKLSTDQAALLGEAARAMGKATGTDAAQGLETISTALTTGRTRGLAMAGILVDVKKAETDFAKSIGTTADQLNAEGQLEAKRIAIFKATQDYVERLGATQLTFAERIKQGQVALEEWGVKLATSVSNSPQVMAALDAIGKALQETFGGTGKTALETIVGWVNKFADAVTEYGPTVIKVFGDITGAIGELFSYLSGHSQDIKDLTKAVALYAAAWAVFSFGGALVTGVVEGLGAIKVAALMGLGAGAVIEGGLFIGLAYGVIKLGESFRGAYADFQASKSMWDYFGNQGKFWDNSIPARAEAWARNQIMPRAPGGPTLPTAFLPPLVNTAPGVTGAFSGQEAADFTKKADPAKIEAATTASIAKTEQLWDEYFALTDKWSNDSTDKQLAQIDRWYVGQKAALDKTAKLNLDYQNQLSALQAIRDEKINQAQNLLTDQATKAVVAQSLAIQEHLIPQLMDWTQLQSRLAGIEMPKTLVGMQTVTNQAALMGDQIAAADRAITESLDSAARDYVPLTAAQEALIQRMKDAGVSAQDMATIMGRSLDFIVAKTYSLRDGLKTIFEGLPNLLINAFTGGGGLSGALKALGVSLGAEFAKALTNSIQRNLAIGGSGFTGTGLIASGGLGIIAGVSTLAQGGSAGQAIGNIGMAAAGVAASTIAATVAANAIAVAAGGMAASTGVIIANAALWGAATAGIGLAAIGAYYGLKKLFSLSEDYKAAKQAQADIVTQLQNMATDAEKAEGAMIDTYHAIATVGRDAFLQIGLGADQADQKVRALLNTSDPVQFARATAQLALVVKAEADVATGVGTLQAAFGNAGQYIPRAMRDSITLLSQMPGLTDAERIALQNLVSSATPSYKDLIDLGAKYNITLEDMGHGVQQLGTEAGAKSLVSDFTELTDAGVDANFVVSKMATQIQQLVTDSLNFGTAIPENMKPLIQILIEQGNLFDVNHRKITDLTGLTFEQTPLEKGLSDLTTAIDKLRDMLSRIPGLLQAINDTPLVPKTITITPVVGGPTLTIPSTGITPTLPPYLGGGTTTPWTYTPPAAPPSAPPTLPTPPLGNVTVPQGFTVPNISIPGITGFASGSYGRIQQPTVYAASGYNLPNEEAQRYVPSYAKVLPFVPKGTDTVPAMLTPGETVRTSAQEDSLQARLNVGGGNRSFLPVSIQVDSREIVRAVVPLIPAELRRRGVA